MNFRRAVLDNGLEIIAEVHPHAASLAAGFFVETGSRDEPPELAGVSHFLEHMVFKGTARRSAERVNLDFDEMGAEYNAFTSEEHTVFYAAVLPARQDQAVDLLADLLRPALRDADFAAEKEVILEEIALYEDLPHFRLHEQLTAAFFAGHPLASPVLGTAETVSSLTAEAMARYFEQRYVAGNVLLAATGAVDFDRLVGAVSAACSDWPAGRAERDRRPAPNHSDRADLADEKVSRARLGRMSPAPAAGDDDRFAASVAATVLGDTSGSRLYYALVEPGLCDEAHTRYAPMDAAGCFHTYASTDPARLSEVRGLLSAEVERFAADGPGEAELEAARNKIASAATVKGETPMGRLIALGLDWTYRREHQPLDEQIDRILAVSADDVRALLGRYDPAIACERTLSPVAEATS